MLIDHCSDIQETKVVFNAIAKNQIAYQCLDVNIEDVVQDIFDTALIIAKRDRNAEGFMLSRFAEIQSGLLMFKGYLISGNFRIEEAIIASAKTAFFIEQMQQNSPSFENFNLNINMDTWSIISPLYNFLNRLKKTNRQAFYYWYKCLELKNLLK